MLQARIPTSADELVFEVSEQDWLDQMSRLFSGDLLAEGPRVRGIVPLAGAHWVVVGGWGVYHGVREVLAQEVVPRATYSEPIWKRCKYRREYAEPHDFYVGRLVTWKRQEWVLVRHFLRLVLVEMPVSARRVAQHRRRKPTPVAVQSSFSEEPNEGGEMGLVLPLLEPA